MTKSKQNGQYLPQYEHDAKKQDVPESELPLF